MVLLIPLKLLFFNWVFLIHPAMSIYNNPSLDLKNSALPKEAEAQVPKEVATLGGGCFWCTEAIFERINGVERVVSGFAGGRKKASYKEVLSGSTGHVETVQITFNPEKVSYEELLEIFFNAHDPTTLNRQGNDVGEQYASVIFYHSAPQRLQAEGYIKKLSREKAYKNPIVTQLRSYDQFYEAGQEHQDYYARNKDKPYCRYVILPKVDKVNKLYQEKLKDTFKQE